MSKSRLLGQIFGAVARELAERIAEADAQERGGGQRSPRAEKTERRARNLAAMTQATERLRIERASKAREEEERGRMAQAGRGVIPLEAIRARHCRPAIALLRPYPPHRAPVGRSRIGGLPDLPAGVDWPRNREGVRLHFLAQVDLAELPVIPDGPGADLPRSGTLLFFARMFAVLRPHGRGAAHGRGPRREAAVRSAVKRPPCPASCRSRAGRQRLGAQLCHRWRAREPHLRRVAVAAGADRVAAGPKCARSELRR